MQKARLVCLCLNPCCNGIYSVRHEEVTYGTYQRCLNPCCNGIYSVRAISSILCISDYWHQKSKYDGQIRKKI